MELYKEIEKNFPILEGLFTEEALSEFRNTQSEELYLYHFGFGTWIRNNLLYPDDNALRSLFHENGITNEDNMSSVIIHQFHQFLLSQT